MNLLESLNDEMRCEIENHFLDKVQFVCVNEQCTATQRLCCGYCKLRSHFNHPSSLIELSTFTNKILRHTQIVQSKLSTIQGSGESTKFLMNRINERMSGMMQRASQAMNVIVNSAEKTIQQALNQVSSVADDRQISQNACEMQMKLQNIMNRPWERQTNEQIALMAKIYNTENTDNFIEEGCFGGCPDVQGISSYIGSVHDRMEQLFNALFEQITLVLRDTSERIGQIRLAQNSAFPSVRLESNSSSLSPSRQPLLQQGTQTPQMQNNLNISNISKDNVNKHNRLQDDRSFDISQEFIPKSNNNTFLPSFLQTPEQIEQNKIKQTKKGNNQKEFNQLLLRGRFDNLDNSQVNGSNITNNNNSSFVQNQEEDTPRQVRKINNRTPQQQQQFMQTPIMNKQKDQVVDHSKAGRQFRLMSLQDGNSMKDNSINVNPQLTKALQKKDEFQQPTQSQQQQQQQSQQPDLQIISKSPYLSNNYQSSSDRAQLLDRLLVNHKKPGDCARLRLHRRAAPSCLGPSYVTLNNPKKQRHSLSQETPQSTKSVQNNQSTQLNNSNIFNYSQHKQVVKNPNQRFFPHMLGIPQAEQQLHRELYNSSDIVMNKVDLRGNSSNNYNNNNQDNLAAHSLSQKHIDFIQDGQQQQQQNTPMHNGQTAGSTILPRIHIKSRNQIFSGDVPQEYSRSVNYSSQPRQEKLILEQQRTHGKQQQDLRRDLEYQQQQSNEDESLRSSKSLQMSHHKLFQKNTKNRKNKEKQEEEQQQQQDEQEEVEEFQLESNQNEKQQHKKVNAGGQKVQAILPNLEVIERGYEQQQQPIKQTGYQGLSPNKKNNYLNSSSNNNNNKLGQSQQEQSSQYAQSPNPLDVQLQQLKEQQHKLQQILQEKEQNQGQQVLSKSSPKKLKNKQDQQEQYYQSQHQAESQQQYYDDNDQNGQGSIRSSLSQVYNSNNNNNNELQQKRHNNSNDQQLSTIPSQNSTEQPLQFNKRHRKQLQSSDNSRQSKYNQEYSDMDENNNTEMLPNRQQKQYTQEGSRNKRYDDQRKRKNISGDSMEEDEDNYQYQDNNYDNDQEMLTQNNKNKDKKKLNQSKQQNTPVYDSEKEYYITDNVHGQRQLTESQPNRSSQQVLVDDQLTKQGGDQISNSQNRRRYKDGNSSEQVYQKKQKEEQQQQQQYEDSQTADMVEQQQPAKRQRTKPTLYLDPQEQGDYQQQYQDKTNQYVKGEQNSKLSNDPIRSSQKQQQQYFDSFMVSNQTPSTNYDQTAFPAGVNGNTGSISNVTAVHNEFNSYSVLSQGNNNQMQYQNGNNQMHNLFYGENHKILQNEDQSDKNYASDMEQQQQSKNNKKRPSVRRQKQQGQQEMIDQDERGRYSQEQESQQQQQFSSKNQTASFEQQRMSSNGSSGYQGVNDQSRTPMVGSSNNSLQKGQMGNKQQEQYYALEDNKQQEIEVENVGNEQGQRQMIEGSKGKLKTSASVKVQQQQQQQQQQKDRYIPIEGQYQSSALEGNQQNQFKQPFQQQQLQAGNDNITRQQPTLSSQQNLSNQQKVQHQTTQELLNENQNKNMNKDGLQNQQQQQQQQNNQIIQQQQQEQLLSGNTNINSQPNNLASQKILSNQQQPQRTQQVLNENMNNNYPNKVESQLQQPMGSSMNGTGQQHAATQQVQNSRDIATQQVQNSRDIATQNKNMNGLETTQPAGRQEGQNNINNKKDQQAISQVGLNQSQGRQTTTGITAGGVGGVSGVSGITANTNPQSVSAVQNNVPQTLLNQPSYEKSTQLQSQQNPSVQNINGQHLQQQQQQPSLLQRKQTEIMNGTVSQQQQIQPSQQQQLSQGYQQQPSQTYQQQPLEFQQLPGKQLENSANPQLASAQEGSMGLKNQNNNVVDQQNISQKIAQPQEINGIGQQRLGDQQLGQQQIGSSSSSQVQVGQINQQGDNQLVQQQNGQLQGLKESQQNQISPNNQINIKENEKQKEQQQQQQQQIQQQNQQQQQEQQQKQQELDQKQQQQNNTSPLIQQSLTPQQQITQPSQNQLITTNSIAQQPSNIQPNTAVSSSVQQQQQVQGLQQIQSGQQQVDSQQVSQKLNQQQQQQLQQSQQKLPQQKNDKHNSKGDLLDNQLGQQQVQSQQQQEIQPVQTSSVQNSQQQQASDSVAKIDTQQPSAVNSIQNKQIDSTIGQQQQQQLGNKTQELNGNTSSQIGQQQQQQIKSNEIVGEQQLKQQSDSIKPDILQGGNQIQPNNTNITSVNKDGVSVSEKGQLKAPQQDSQGIQQEEQKVIDQGKDINNQLDQDPMKKNGNIPTDSQQQQQQNLTSSQNKLNQLSQQQQSPSGQQQQQQQSQSHLIQQSQISEVIKKSRRVIQPPIPDYPQEFKASEYQIQVSNNPLEFLTNPIENDMKTLKINKPPYGWIPQKQYPHKFAALQTLKKTQDKYGYLNIPEKLDKQSRLMLQQAENNQIFYDGEWLKGERHGKGTQIMENGSIYQGQWENGHMSGKGRLITKENNVYEGDLVENMIIGKGVMHFADGTEYYGNWKDNNFEGFGKKQWPEGAYYQGMFVAGVKQGKGTFIWDDGSYFQGDFEANKFNGKGTYQWKNSRRYEGDWKDGKMDGQGREESEKGIIYEGAFKDDKKHGFGVLILNEKKRYEGNWEYDKPKGQGVLIDNGVSQAGIWSDGKFYRENV